MAGEGEALVRPFEDLDADEGAPSTSRDRQAPDKMQAVPRPIARSPHQTATLLASRISVLGADRPNSGRPPGRKVPGAAAPRGSSS